MFFMGSGGCQESDRPLFKWDSSHSSLEEVFAILCSLGAGEDSLLAVVFAVVVSAFLFTPFSSTETEVSTKSGMATSPSEAFGIREQPFSSHGPGLFLLN